MQNLSFVAADGGGGDAGGDGDVMIVTVVKAITVMVGLYN